MVRKSATTEAKQAKQAKAEARKARSAALKAKTEAARAKSKAAAARAAGPASGFMNFVREKGVIGLAVGLAIGTAATGVVAQIVGAVITPTIVLLLGANGLESFNTTVTIGNRSADYNFGSLLDALLKFIAIAAVIYFVVHGLKLDRLDKKKE